MLKLIQKQQNKSPPAFERKNKMSFDQLNYFWVAKNYLKFAHFYTSGNKFSL